MSTTNISFTQQTQDMLKTDSSPKVTIRCAICEAGYVVSPTQQSLLRSSLNMIEAAFMSRCHFCFRCRRPACPECWDEINGLCGACVQEANLFFRTPVTPLKGTLFPVTNPTTWEVSDAEKEPLFDCVLPGRFSLANRLQGEKTVSTDPVQAVSFDQLHTDKQSQLSFSAAPPLKLPQKQPGSAAKIRPMQFISMDTQPTPATTITLEDESEHLSSIEIQSVPVPAISKPEKVKKSREEAKAKQKQESSASTKPAKKAEKTTEKTKAKKRKKSSDGSVFRVIERVITVLLFMALGVMVGLIVLAQYSAEANYQILHLIHIDIRAEIAYLLHLIHQIHW